MSECARLEKLLHDLSDAISEAILGAPAALEMVRRMFRETPSLQNTRLVLVLKLRALTELVRTGKVDWRYVSWEPTLSHLQQSAEGQPHVPEETLFEGRAGCTFDEQAWMRSVGIRLDL